MSNDAVAWKFFTLKVFTKSCILSYINKIKFVKLLGNDNNVLVEIKDK